MIDMPGSTTPQFWILSLLLLPWGAAVAAPPSHCSPSEQVIYSCKLKNSAKIVSLCASKRLSDRAGYLQYRFGRPGRIELEFPTERLDSQKRFEYAHYFRFQYDLTELRFASGDHQYALYDYYNGEEQPAQSTTGVRVGEISLACDGPPGINRLSTLEKVVPAGSI